MASAFAAWIFRLAGWKVAGPLPIISKAIWVVAPHTSNWDFLVGIGARAIISIEMQYLAKKELFTWYAGWFFRMLGGKPVDRSRATHLVDAVVSMFNNHDQLHICITPEGTRGNVQKLRLGFYYMALKANVPLVLVGIDYPRKTVFLYAPVYITGDFTKDMKPIYEFYHQIQGKRKEWLKRYEETGVIEK